MTRVLFLDDEPLALQGLQRMLRSMRGEWDMVFASHGPPALELMSQSPFDIVVTDMLMPGMNGPQFLDEVRARHPETVRLVLSGHADRGLVLQCLKSAHQFLNKPCSAEILKSTVAQMSALRSTLQNDSIRRVITRINCVPSVPKLYSAVTQKLQQPEVTVEEIAEAVTEDVGMTAKTLQLMNAGFFGARKVVSSAADAVSLLGLDNIRALLQSNQAFSPCASEGVGETSWSWEALWKHSRDTALAAKVIALAENAGKRVVDDAFTAGLLHDVGKFVLVSHFAAQYTEVVQLAKTRGLGSSSAEEEVFQVSHAEVGGYLLGLWGLPASVVEAVAWHHTPNRSAAKTFTPLTAVHVADALMRDGPGARNGFPFARVDSQHLHELGLAGRLDCWRGALREHLSFAA